MMSSGATRVWVISVKRLREFGSKHPRARGPLREWYDVVSAASWRTFGDVRATYASADLVGNCVVFNVSGNHYRLIARIFYASHKVYILAVLTHAEYDRGTWFDECRCDKPPPKHNRRGPAA